MKTGISKQNKSPLAPAAKYCTYSWQITLRIYMRIPTILVEISFQRNHFKTIDVQTQESIRFITQKASPK